MNGRDNNHSLVNFFLRIFLALVICFSNTSTTPLNHSFIRNIIFEMTGFNKQALSCINHRHVAF